MDISAQALLFPFACFLLSCLFVLAATKSRRSPGGTAALPPGPPPLPIIGNILHFGKNPHCSLTELSKTYGPVMSLKLGTVTTVVVSSPEAAKEVLQVHDQVLSGRTSTDPIRSYGHHEVSVAWMPPSPLWRQLRKISVMQLFLSKRLDETKSLRMKKVEDLLKFTSESCERGEAIAIANASFVTSLNIISNALFSIDFACHDSQSSNDYHDTVVRYMEVSGKPNMANFFPALGFLDLQGTRKEIKECVGRLFRVFQGIIDARTAERLSRTKPKDVSSIDLLDYLLDLEKNGGKEINMNVIKHMFLQADTNSGTVEWAMAELLKRRETMATAQTEIEKVLGETPSVQESDISRLSYLQAVVKETLRLHPPSPFLLPRKAESDVKIFDFLVPKDAEVLVNVWAIGRDLSVWDNPMEFEPERFMGREIDVKGTDFELTPFGAGRRICPGMPLALRTAPLVLASLLHGFDWKLENGVVPEDLDMDEAYGITLHKANPLCAIPIKKRLVSASSP
ncbi:PREDICTED: cytochrome P450 76C4-like [Tarenaya hassleriana]|uniref:cytochrome P450 76C4-like n=1 Tax=Tarenaya hassleriana TaxID=28532 RepID=UPI00053C92DA|nr:PREDICTED: cytochrome P450 76C4-like [Tarenaya hassleriana]